MKTDEKKKAGRLEATDLPTWNYPADFRIKALISE